jgi:uncharacterized protein (TIRG00374 family)
MKLRDLLKLLISLMIIAAILGYLWRGDYFKVAKDISIPDWLLLCGLTFGLYLLSGIQMLNLTAKVSGRKLHLSDVLFMPMSMSLFSYFIPTNGGFFYAVYFLKKKYDVDSAKGFSVGVVSVYISFILSGMALFITSLVLGILHWYLFLLSILLMLSPVLIFVADLFLQRIPAKQGSRFEGIKSWFHRIITHSNTMMMDAKLVLINIAITFGTLLIFFLLYYRLNVALNLGLPLISLIALMAMMRISGLIRLLPGNLGLEELFTAAIFGIIGHDPAAGLVFSVFMRICSLIIMIPAGVLHTAFNSKYFSYKDFKAILKSGKQKDQSEVPSE